MGEAEVAAELVAAVRAQIGAAWVLRGVTVEVGERVEIDPGALAAAMRAALPGTEVRVEQVPVLYRCADCGAEFPADEHPCASCGSARVMLVRGEELAVTRAQVEPAEPVSGGAPQG